GQCQVGRQRDAVAERDPDVEPAGNTSLNHDTGCYRCPRFGLASAMSRGVPCRRRVMEATNLAELYRSPLLDWSGIEARLREGLSQARAPGARTVTPAGWPARADDTGLALTAEYSAPSAGPPPWHVYRLTPHTATAVGTVEPGGATWWRF